MYELIVLGEKLPFADIQKSCDVPLNSCDNCTYSLENGKTVSKNEQKQLRKTII